MKNFQAIGTFDPLPLLHQVQRRPELWDLNPLRTRHAQTAHREVSDIWVRFQDVRAYEQTGEAASIVDEHESIWYPAATQLPAARTLLYQLMTKVEGERLGRVLITRLAPGKRIYPHADGGAHAAYYSRYHLVLQAFAGCQFHCGGEEVFMPPGTVWWFNNGLEHEVVNNGRDDRIHLIADIRTWRQ